MDEEIVAVVKAHTDPDEAVLWVGRPSPLAYALRSNGLLAIMGFAGVGLMVTLAVDAFQLSQRYPRSSPSFFQPGAHSSYLE